MSALLAGELRRVLARRLVRVVFGAAAIAIVAAGLIVFLRTHAISEAAYQAKVKAADAAAGSEFPGQPPGIPQCPSGPSGGSGPNGANGGSASGGANGLGGQSVAVQSGPDGQPACISFSVGVHDPRFHLTGLKGILEGVTIPLAILACLIGATVIGAEWPSRTITTILTWEPRRLRVLAAKALAAMAVAMALALVGLVVLSLVLLPSALLHGTTSGTNGGWWWTSAGVAVRAVAIVAIFTIMGFSIAAVGRNTAAALGALFGYVVVFENLIAHLVTGWRQWLIIGNAAIFVSGKAGNFEGSHNRSVTVAGLYLAALAVGLYAVAAVVFRRRDVA